MTCLLFLRRRRKKQHPRRRAAAPRSPSGIPTPRPTFCRLVSPSLLAGGESGAVAAPELWVEVEVADRVEEALEPETVEDVLDPLLEDLIDDLIEVENVTTEDTIAVGEPDADAADDCIALLGAEYDAEGVACEDCCAVVDSGHCQTESVGVACTPVVWDGAESHAVSGPNSLIR